MSALIQLHISTPERTLVQAQVEAVSAYGLEGHFTLLARHRDWISLLQPGLCHARAPDQHWWLALDHGLLLKCGPQVRIRVRQAYQDSDPQALQAHIEQSIRQVDTLERQTRSTLARLEAGLVRQMGRRW